MIVIMFHPLQTLVRTDSPILTPTLMLRENMETKTQQPKQTKKTASNLRFLQEHGKDAQ